MYVLVHSRRQGLAGFNPISDFVSAVLQPISGAFGARQATKQAHTASDAEVRAAQLALEQSQEATRQAAIAAQSQAQRSRTTLMAVGIGSAAVVLGLMFYSRRRK